MARAQMLVATHDLDFAARSCHRWVLIEGGTIARRGTDFDQAGDL